MPFSFRIHEGLDLLFIKADGLLTPELLRGCVTEYVSHSDFHSGLDVLISLSEGAFVEIDGREQSPIVLAEKDVLKKARDVLASSRQDVPHRVACAGGSSKIRTFAVAAVGLMDRQSEIAAFKETAAALEWLGQEEAAMRVVEK